MTKKEMTIKVLSMIEEVKTTSKSYTDDPDLAAKLPDVMNQVMYELARMKKIPKYVPMKVSEGEVVEFADIERACGYEIYQISAVHGVAHERRASGTVIKVLESGTLELDVFVYPERITASTSDSYEFELSPDALEIMPYGVAGDLLKSDKSSQYGNIYSQRYESMLQRLDYRYSTGTFTVEGGVMI